jgi:hypothetical protein
VHDIRELEFVLESMPFLLPDYEPDAPYGFCADKGYESKSVRTLIWRKDIRTISAAAARKKTTSRTYLVTDASTPILG